MRQLVALVDDAVMHVRGLFAVVEEQQLAGFRVDLRVRRHTPVDREVPVPGLLAQGAGGERVDAVQIAALVEAGQRDAPVDDDVGARRVLHPGAGAPTVRRAWPAAPARPGPATAARPPRSRPGSHRCGQSGCGRTLFRHGIRRRAACRRRRTGDRSSAPGAAGSRCCAGRRRRGRAGSHPRRRPGRRRPTRWSAAATARFGRDGRRLRAGSTGTCRRLRRPSQDPSVALTTKLTVVAVLPPKFSVPKVFAFST